MAVRSASARLDRICSDAAQVDLGGLSVEHRQLLLMALVPKRIAKDAHHHGWKVDTIENLRYGNADAHPKVTWVFRFTWDSRTSDQSETVYSEALELVFSKGGRIDGDGKVTYG